MRLEARVTKLESGEEYTDKVQRAEIRVIDPALHGYHDVLFVRNTDGWVLGQHVVIDIHVEPISKEAVV